MKAGEYEETIRQIYKGLLKFKPATLYGKPDTRTRGAYLVVETIDGERLGCERLFIQIQEALSLMNKIPEKELGSDGGVQLLNLIKFIVMKLEYFHTQHAKSANDRI